MQNNLPKLINAVLENVRDAIIVTDSSGNVIFWNRVSELIFGYGSEEAIGKNVLDLIVPEKHKSDVQNGLKKCRSGSARIIEATAIDKQGREFPVELTIACVEFDDGNVIIVYVRDISERLRLREELETTRDFYRLLVENVIDAVFVVDVSGVLQYVSPSIEQISGYKPEEVIGKHFSEFIHSEDRESFREIFKKRFEGYSEFHEYRIVRKDGTIRYCQSTSRPVYKGGVLVGLAGIIRDITDQKMMEFSLRESEEKFRLLAEKSLVGVYIIKDWVFEYVNPKLAEIYGRSVDELVSSNVLNFVHPEDRELVRSNIAKRITGEVESVRYTFRIIRGDGEVRHVEVYGSRMTYGGKAAIIGTLIDITEEIEIRKKLKESEELFRALSEHSPAGVYMVRGGRFIYVNPTMEEITGYSKDELLRMNPISLVHPDFAQLVWNRYMKRERGEDVPSRYEFKIISRDGREKWIDVMATRVVIDGKPAVLGNFIDITRRKEMEENLKRMNRLLAAISEINQSIVRQVTGKKLLKNMCRVLARTGDFSLVWVGTGKDELESVAYAGMKLKNDELQSISRCNAVLSCLKMRKHVVKTCRECDDCRLRDKVGSAYVFATPLSYGRSLYGAVFLVSNRRFQEDEVQYLVEISRNVSLVLRNEEVAREREVILDQLKRNVEQFEFLSDKLRNPLAVIRGYLDVRDLVEDREKIFNELEQQVRRIEKILEQMEKEEHRTYRLSKMLK